MKTVESSELFARWHERRDPDAREELVRRFLPLARKLASRYSGGLEQLDDLMQVASLGLLKAMDRFDPARGTTFSSFAVPTILGELKRYFRDTGWAAHVPRGAQELALRVQQAEHRLTGTTGKSPSVAALAEYLELSIEATVEALEAASAHHADSLDAATNDTDGDAVTLGDTFGEEDLGFERVDAIATIGAAARDLSEQERRVLALRFFHDLPQTEIAQQTGISQMQVSRVLRRALRRLAERTDEDAQTDRDPISAWNGARVGSTGVRHRIAPARPWL
jgi:RNA polymerase sigma-B factor